jgi:poly-gamma-glutamate synthesis protein (capsule biosynthesis protein)
MTVKFQYWAAIMKTKATIGLAGDLMMGRGVNEAIITKGHFYPWGNLLPLLTSTDINIVNLESTLTNSNRKTPKVFNFKAAPENVNTLKVAQITAVNLANNHILDYSEEGLAETIATLDNAGIKHTGAGANSREAAKPVILNCAGISVGMIGFTDNEEDWEAGLSSPGTNYINILKRAGRKKALDSIQQFSREVELAVVSIHWGPNMKEYPSVEFVEFAHEMINAGAGIVHGHSAHITQGIEIFQNKPVLYDTGDFLDDYAVDPFLRNDHSFLFMAEVDHEGVYNLRLVPVRISNCQVNRASESEAVWNLGRIQQLSLAFGTKINDSGEVACRAEIMQ